MSVSAKACHSLPIVTSVKSRSDNFRVKILVKVFKDLYLR